MTRHSPQIEQRELVFLDKQLRPFIEYRYNPFFLEGSLHVGLMYFPKISRKLRYDCPAYN